MVVAWAMPPMIPWFLSIIRGRQAKLELSSMIRETRCVVLDLEVTVTE